MYNNKTIMPFLVTQSAKIAKYYTYIFHLGNKEYKLATSYYFDVGMSIALRGTEDYYNSGMKLVVSRIELNQNSGGNEVYDVELQLAELNFFDKYWILPTLQTKSENNNGDLQVNLFHHAEGSSTREMFDTDESPLPETEFVCGKTIYQPKQCFWDFTQPEVKVAYLVEKHIHSSTQSYQPVKSTVQNEPGTSTLLNNKQVLDNALRAYLGNNISLQSSALQRLGRLLGIMQNRMQVARSMRHKNGFLRSFMRNFQQMFELKNSDSKVQRRKAIIRGIYHLLKRVSDYIPGFGLGDLYEHFLKRVYDRVREHWKHQNKQQLASPIALERMDAATDEALEGGVAKIVYLYWEMMHLYQKVKQVNARDISGDVRKVHDALNRLLELEEIQKEARETLDVISCFIKEMRNDADKMDTDLAAQKASILAEMLRLTDREALPVG